METRIAVEEPTMPFPSHVSAPFMLGDELFMPDSVAPMAQAAYLMAEEGSVMTANQLETLRRQISVYATICQQLVEMHKASMSYRPALSGVLLPGQAMPFDSLVGTHKAPSRQRWAPSHSQLQILEKIFDQINGTPNKQKIKEITAELSQYGQITETNVYNWFQNRKARAKRKHQSTTQKDGDSGGDTDGDSIDKKVRVDTSPDNCSGHNSGGSSGVHAYDQDQTSCFRSDTYVNSSSGLQGMASGHYKGLGGKNLGGKA